MLPVTSVKFQHGPMSSNTRVQAQKKMKMQWHFIVRHNGGNLDVNLECTIWSTSGGAVLPREKSVLCTSFGLLPSSLSSIS